MRPTLTAVCLSLFGLDSMLADKADSFFDAAKVHEIRLYFADSNWYN
jgi:hypothetical protein